MDIFLDHSTSIRIDYFALSMWNIVLPLARIFFPIDCFQVSLAMPDPIVEFTCIFKFTNRG